MKIKCKQCPMNNNCVCDDSYDKCVIRTESYNKALEDFAKSLLVNKVIDRSVVRRVAEQLKRGGE